MNDKHVILNEVKDLQKDAGIHSTSSVQVNSVRQGCMGVEKQYITNSVEDTQKLGEKFAYRIRSDFVQGRTLTTASVIALYGDLGSGKTTFVQGLAKGLGIKRRIISPTFVIVRQYEIKSHAMSSQSASWRSGDLKKIASSPFDELRVSRNDISQFYHIDLYRTENDKDIEGLGLKEILSDPQNIVVIEWAEKMGNLLPEKRIDIRFEYLDEGTRRIIIE